MFKRLIWIFSILLLSVAIIRAQSECLPLVQQALSAVNGNCNALGRNQACYGNVRVHADFIASEHPQFTIPSDMIEIVDITALNTLPLNTQSGEWGVAVMNLQTNIPNSLPGQNVIFVLMGDTQLENAAPPESSFYPIDAVPVRVTAPGGANVRTGPGTGYLIFGGVSPQDTILTDGISADHDWLRVVLGNHVGWLSRDLVTSDASLDDLPVIDANLRSPMQAFYLRSGIGSADCAVAPDALLVQTPRNIPIEITVNGANLRIGSTVLLSMPRQDLLEIVVLDGRAQILDANNETTGTTIYTGQRSTACLGDPQNRGLDGQPNDLVVTCDFSPPEDIPYQELAATYCELQGIATLNYPVDLYCPGETLISGASLGGASDSQIPEVDCRSFALLGPFENITPRPTTFGWTEASGATDYEIVFYNYAGAVAGSFWTQITNITLNVGEIPTGSELAWEVRAYRSGTYACVSSRTPVIYRLADPGSAAGSGSSGTGTSGSAAPYSASWGCSGNDVITFNWSDLPPGTTTISFNYTVVGGSGGNRTVSSPLTTGTVMQGYTALAASPEVQNASVSIMPSGAGFWLSPATLDCD